MLVLECFTSLVLVILVFIIITASTPVMVDVSPRVFHQPSTRDIGVYYDNCIHTSDGRLLVLECFTSLVVLILVFIIITESTSVLVYVNPRVCYNKIVL